MAADDMNFAEGLQFPEGPDGSVILVEIQRGTLSRVWNGKVESSRTLVAGRMVLRWVPTVPSTCAVGFLPGCLEYSS
jgi:hypothetical protein